MRKKQRKSKEVGFSSKVDVRNYPRAMDTGGIPDKGYFSLGLSLDGFSNEEVFTEEHPSLELRDDFPTVYDEKERRQILKESGYTVKSKPTEMKDEKTSFLESRNSTPFCSCSHKKQGGPKNMKKRNRGNGIKGSVVGEGGLCGIGSGCECVVDEVGCFHGRGSHGCGCGDSCLNKSQDTYYNFNEAAIDEYRAKWVTQKRKMNNKRVRDEVAPRAVGTRSSKRRRTNSNMAEDDVLNVRSNGDNNCNKKSRYSLRIRSHVTRNNIH